ncbi:proteasome subunit beta type-1-like [Drosophila kikkawai]|uniref:Proteasome subunit beta type-1-like n=1 Tax=Drosophila kikkawai TaxID=30033 RepID=A0A6P4ISY3_DROKI|nr:proteasome subunit beta type-1-like [Drosophila kikkawai]
METDKEDLLNVGTIVAIAGGDFAVIATDTQITNSDFNSTSKQDKLFQVSPVAVMSSSGSWPDTLAVIRLMKTIVADYESTHLRPITIDAMSQMFSNNMFKRRYLPYCVSTILAGIDKKGEGVVFSFDSLGHCQQVIYQAAGMATAMVLPLLDSHLGFTNQSETAPTERIKVTEAVSIISNCMVIANELENLTSGSWLMKIITKDGIEVRELPLRQE